MTQVSFITELAQKVIEKHGTLQASVNFDGLFYVQGESGTNATSFNFVSALLKLLVKEIKK